VRTLIVLLIFLSAMPDTMAAPVVKELFMDRYGASPSMAQLFNGINLFGAFAALPLLWFVRGKNHSVALVIWGSLADAFLLAVMALPLGLEWTLVVRALEGVTDVIVFAALFDLVRRSSRGHVGAGMGIASSPLLMGLGFGAMLGGLVVRQSAEGVSANWLFGLSAVLSIFVAGIAFIARRRIETFQPSSLVEIANDDADIESQSQVRDPMWPSLAMTFSDRATGGLITGTLPIALSQVFGYSPLVRGLLVGLPLLLMALGTGPAGWLCDRVGSLRVRIFAGVAYAASFALLSVAGDRAVPLGIVMVIIGLSASALFSSSISLVIRSGPATMALGAFRGVGDLGFLSGTAFSVLLLSSLGGESPTYFNYAAVLTIFAGFHALTTLITGVTLKISRNRNTVASRSLTTPQAQ
jgi:MFS family permease